MLAASSVTSADAEHAAVVKRLREPSAYPERPRRVGLVETHISQVFLTDDYVYKLKKPVRFDFLDFGTPEKRQAACREELQLNRRMTRDVYLAVWPVTQDSTGRLTLNGPGRAVDWVVRMRRLPAERMLDELIRSGRLTDVDTRRLADFLGRYYSAVQPQIVNPAEFHASLVAHATGNFRALSAAPDLDASLVRRIHTAQFRLLKSRPELFYARALDGRIIDGHGDLRPEHVCLTDPPAVFDCIEFSADLRRVDVLDELCFLAMECDALQARPVGELVLRTYESQSGDRPPPELTPFYKTYRACVRGKVAILRAAQLPDDQRPATQRLAERYLRLADEYVRTAGCRPLLVAVSGLMGTGKSTLARRLADELGTEVLGTDEIRAAVLPRDGRPAAFGEGRYGAEARARVYAELLRRAAERSARGLSVILDGTFTETTHREAVKELGRTTGADVLIVECTCPRETAIERIRARSDRDEAGDSEARPELYDLQADERRRAGRAFVDFSVDTTESPAAQAARVLQALPSAFAP